MPVDNSTVPTLTNTYVNTIDYDCGISGTVELPHDIEIWGDANCHLREERFSLTKSKTDKNTHKQKNPNK